MIEEKEIVLAKRVIELAKENGATSCKVVLNKSTSDLIDTLNGEIDKVSHCLDRSLCLTLIIDGRFASFSTNKLEEKELEDFVKTSISITRILEEDWYCRRTAAPWVSCVAGIFCAISLMAAWTWPAFML